MQLSQSAQLQTLQSLHDQEVSSLMKRLDTQTKEDLASLSKKHKDKNELARIKRELQQRLIDQAVCERQRFSTLLEKRKAELESRHEEVRQKFEEEKVKELEKRKREYLEKCDKLMREFEANPSLFVANITRSTSATSASSGTVAISSSSELRSLPQHHPHSS